VIKLHVLEVLPFLNPFILLHLQLFLLANTVDPTHPTVSTVLF